MTTTHDLCFYVKGKTVKLHFVKEDGNWVCRTNDEFMDDLTNFFRKETGKASVNIVTEINYDT